MKTIRLDAQEVQKRLFELLDKIVSKTLSKVEIETHGKVVAQITPISN